MFKEWKSHPVTDLLLRWANEKKETLKEQWASGGFMGPSFDECVVRNAAAQGAISILDDLLNISYEEFNND
jgi:hypothetical protein